MLGVEMQAALRLPEAASKIKRIGRRFIQAPFQLNIRAILALATDLQLQLQLNRVAVS
jgi:hypothetical protein